MSEMKFTAAELRDCAMREVVQRRRVYPGLVQRGRMSPKEMERQIAMMTQIAGDYAAQAAAEAANADLFGGK